MILAREIHTVMVNCQWIVLVTGVTGNEASEAVIM
jgi:hypothetical protein